MNIATEIGSNLAEKIDFLHTQAVEKHKQGALTIAVDFYMKSIELQKEQPAWIYGNVITLLNQLDKVDEALEIGKLALEIYPNSAEILRALGSLYKKNGPLIDSIKFYQHAIEIDHNQPGWVYEHLIESLNQQNYFEQAIKYGKLGIEINPQSCWLKYHLANTFAEKELWDKASELYIQILEVKPDFSNVADKLNEAVSHQTNKEQNLTYELLKTTQEQVFESDSVEEQEIQAINYNNSFAAKITQVNLGGFIQGWAIDNANPESQIKIKIVADGQSIGIVKATKNITTKVNKNLKGIPKEFQLQIPTTLLDDQEHQFELISLKDDQSITTSIKVPRRGIGRIDGYKNNYLMGWAIPDGHFDSSANIDIYIDNIFYTEIQANKPRKDLLKHGLGNGNNGFKIILPLPPKQKKSYQVDVFFKGTKNHLKKSPIYVENCISDKSNQPLFLANITEVNSGGLLTGWAIDNANPDSNLKIKVIADGNPISVFKATKNYPDVVEGPLAAVPKEFQIQLPFTLLDDQEHQFELILLDDQQNAAQPIKLRVKIPRQRVGRIDGWNNNYVTGWALPEGHHGTPAVLDVYIDGTFYQEIRANTSRKDLLKYSLGNGKNGFEFALPLPPENKETYQVDIFF